MKFKEKLNQAAGFTLVELIVVIAILAILAGVAVPAYSGYIEKANLAADQQLLAAVNKAFAAACAENGADPYNLSKTPTLKLEGEVGAKTVGDIDLYNEDFDNYFKGNETAVFKVYSFLKFENGAFVPGDTSFNSILSILAGMTGDISSLNSSVFVELGMEKLLGKVDFATQLAASGEHDKLNELVSASENLESIALYMGYSSAEDSEFQKKFTALLQQKAANIAAIEGGQAEDYAARAYKEILSNNAVLVAATKYSDVNTADFATLLGSGTAKTTIKENMKNDPQKALAQAAFAYAMYTSYAAHNNIAVNEELKLDEVLDIMDSQAFKDYMNNTDGTGAAAVDIAGYEAAMNMINQSSQDSNAVSTILLDGFSDSDLLALLQQVTGNN